MRHILNLFVFLVTLSGLYAQNTLDCSVSPPEWIQGVWLSQEHDGYEFTNDEIIVYDGQHSKTYYTTWCEMQLNMFKADETSYSICFDKVFINETISSSTLYQFEFRECTYSQNYRFERIDDFTIAEHFLEGETVYYRKQ